MTGIVYGSNIKIAIKQLEKIIDNYTRFHILPLRYIRSKYNARVEFDNGDYWQAVVPCDGARARRCNVAYIDSTINQLVIDQVIKPCVTNPPFQAYNYF